MKDPNASDETNQSLMDDLNTEFMALAAKGDRAVFDFALEFSDAANEKAQELLMSLMNISGLGSADIALWTVMARQSFLNVLQKDVAAEWVQTEYARLHKENLAMQDEWETTE